MLTEVEARIHLERPLEYPGLAVKKGALEILRLLRSPAFDPEAVWSLNKIGDEFFLRRIVYTVNRDGQSGVTTHNTFGVESSILTSKTEEVLDQLGRITLRPFVPGHTGPGIDGCIYGVRVGHYMKQAELTWWCKPPDDWSVLRDWYARTIMEFEAHLAASSVPIQEKHPWVE